MPVAKEQVGDVPEGLVPAIKLEPPPGFEQDEWEQLTDWGSRKGRPINLSVPYTGSLSGSARAIAQRERKALFDKEEKVLESVRTADRSAKYQLKKSLLQQPKYKLANSARQAKLLEKEWDILSEKRFTQKSLDILAIPIAQVGVERVFNVAKDVIGSRRHRLSARTIQQIMVLKDTISQEEEQGLDYLVAQLGEDGEPIDEVNDLFELPASLEHTFDIDEENQTTEEESEEEVQEERHCHLESASVLSATYAKWAYASLLLYEVVLVGELLYVVVEQGGATLALEERLADKVKRVRSAAEALAYDPSSIAANNLSEILLRLQAAKEIAEYEKDALRAALHVHQKPRNRHEPPLDLQQRKRSIQGQFGGRRASFERPASGS
ncbi:hypothetical protein A1F94_003986 [Pyrenophora tritici-repentis]|nr:hypothetical protein A1F94_003986 [Pyrenophora tritici-repentis]